MPAMMMRNAMWRRSTGVPRLLACLALIGLSGCWTGGPFFAATDAVPAIAAGTYDATATSFKKGPPEKGTLKIVIRPDGMTALVDGDPNAPQDPAFVMGFAPMKGKAAVHILWITRWDKQDLSGARNAYGILTRSGDGTFKIILPICKDSGQALATANGAQIDTGTPEERITRCRFASRESLTAALKAFAASPPADMPTIILHRRR